MEQSLGRYKIAIVGDGGVGKTTFLHRHLVGEFTRNYNPTLGADIHPLTFYTNYGLITFDCWDVAGQDKFGGLQDAYYVQVDGCMIFFDVTSRASYAHVGFWHEKVKRVCGNLPMVLCGNKVDIPGRKVLCPDIRYHLEHKCMYFDISAKSNYNYEKPFLELARAMTGRPDLAFVAGPAVRPPLVVPQNPPPLMSSL